MLHSVAGFTAVSGTTEALGSVRLTAIGFRHCVLYQDIALPVGTTVLTFGSDFASRAIGVLTAGDTALLLASIRPLPCQTSFKPHHTVQCW